MKPAKAALVLAGRSGAASPAPRPRTMPKGLYARALLIIILPMVILQSAIALVFMERHWQLVTFRLSEAVTPGHRRPDRHPPRFRRFRPRQRQTGDDRPEPARSRSGGAAGGAPAAGPAQTVLLAGRPRHVVGDRKADQKALLDRHGRAFGLHRSAHRHGRRHSARGRASQPGLCLQRPYLHRLDGRDVGGADRWWPSCSCATRSGRSSPWPTRRRNSARAAMSSSGRAARAKCGAPPTPSSK